METEVIARLQDIGDPGSLEFLAIVNGSPIRGFVVRRGAQVRAYLNRCPHAGFPLSRNPAGHLAPDGQSIMCRMHGALFDIDSGKCIDGICIGESLLPLQVRVADGLVRLDEERMT